MSPIGIHALTVPVFTTLLDRMGAWLDLAQAHCDANSIHIDAMLQERLAPDMFTLLGQYQMATAFAKNCVCRLAGQVPPDFPDVEKTEADVRARIARARSIVQSVTEAMLEGAAGRDVTIQLGPDLKRTLTGEAYLLNFSLPQFYFHASMAYAILRHKGVPLGKRDFLAAQ